MNELKFFEKLDEIYSKIKSELHYFYNKDTEYAINFFKWIYEVTIKNRIINSAKCTRDKEMVRRRRGQVYWIDFGKNIGSEFNDEHFCVVLKESKYTAIVAPISSQKETDGHWKEEDDLIVKIGAIADLPGEKPLSYAMVNQIRSVSKQRLSDYKYKSEYKKLKLSNEQLDLIDQALMSICKKNK